jgi:preprotein translocase subunit SecD
MASQIQLPVLLSLLPKVGKMIQVEQDRPSMQQALAAEQMRDHLRQEREQVSELKKTQETLHVRSDAERDRRHADQHSRKDRHPKEEEEAAPDTTDPWSGQIVNIKV